MRRAIVLLDSIIIQIFGQYLNNLLYAKQRGCFANDPAAMHLSVSGRNIVSVTFRIVIVSLFVASSGVVGKEVSSDGGKGIYIDLIGKQRTFVLQIMRRDQFNCTTLESFRVHRERDHILVFDDIVFPDESRLVVPIEHLYEFYLKTSCMDVCQKYIEVRKGTSQLLELRLLFSNDNELIQIVKQEAR